MGVCAQLEEGFAGEHQTQTPGERRTQVAMEM